MEWCIFCAIGYFYSEGAVTMSSVYLIFFVFFFFSVFEFSIPNIPPFLVVGFAEEDEADKADEVGDGVRQV